MSGGGVLRVRGSLFEDNSAAMGGAIDTTWALVLRDSEFRNNHAAYGGAVSTDVWRLPVVIQDSAFTGNTATDGAALNLGLEKGRAEIARSTFCNNSATGNGGAAYLYGNHTTMVLRGNLFDHNRAGRGGAVSARSWGSYYVGGDFVFTAVKNTFLASHASVTGAAIEVDVMAASELQNNSIVWSTGALAVTTADWDHANHNLWFENALGDTDAGTGPAAVFADPMYTDYLPDTDCSNDDLTPLPGSPLIDAGHPGYSDADGTRSDIGHGG